MTVVALGIDIGGSSVKGVVLADGVIRSRQRSAVYQEGTKRAVMEAIAEVAAALGVASAGAVGVCVPGVVEGLKVVRSVNLPALEGESLDALVGEALARASVPVVVIPDARAAVIDAAAEEGLTGRVLGVSLGTGVGGAVIDDGVPLRVSGESSGHLGQIDVRLDGDANPPVGADGGVGTLEAYIGAPALTRRYGAVFDPAGMGLDEAPLRALVKGLRIAHAIYRPRHVRLLGGIGIRLGALTEGLRERVAIGLTGLARPGWTLGCGKHDFHAAGGAARVAARG